VIDPYTASVVDFRHSPRAPIPAALRNIDECVSHGLRKTERDEQLFRVKIILTGLIDNSELPMLLRLRVRQSLVEFSRLQCGRIAIISNANNKPPSVTCDYSR